MQKHIHTLNRIATASGAGEAYEFRADATAVTTQVMTTHMGAPLEYDSGGTPRTAAETRMKSIGAHLIIKY
jgi:hypothetical protein